jgi:hypothetical protein
MHYRRPTSVKVFGILNLVFAGLGVIGLLFTYSMYFGGMKLGPNPAIDIARSQPAYMSFLEITLVVGLLAAGVLAATGMGLLAMKAWARKLVMAFAVFRIIMNIVEGVVTYIYVLEPMMHRLGAGGAGIFGGVFGGILGCVYPILLLVFMTRGNVVDAFRLANPEVPEARIHR